MRWRCLPADKRMDPRATGIYWGGNAKFFRMAAALA
jgi:hypothetical protein